jgi:hypothetical protein
MARFYLQIDQSYNTLKWLTFWWRLNILSAPTVHFYNQQRILEFFIPGIDYLKKKRPPKMELFLRNLVLKLKLPGINDKTGKTTAKPFDFLLGYNFSVKDVHFLF